MTCAPVRTLRDLRIEIPGEGREAHLLTLDGRRARCGAPVGLAPLEAPADWPTCTLCARRQPKEKR